MTKVSKLASVGWLAMAVAAPAFAQATPTGTAARPLADEALGEIVVTANRLGEARIQDTPIAVSAFSGKQLAESGMTDVRDLAGYVPNLSISRTTTFAQIFIRGIGSTNVYGGSDPSVSLQVDGVYIGRSFAQFSDFLDVARVEVLRGPQGTLYGRNAVGGTINIISAVPTTSFSGQAALSYGNHNRVQAQAMVSGPLSPTVSVSLAASYLYHDPYVKNIVASGNDLNDANRGGVRGQIRFEPNDRFNMTTRADYSRAGEATLSYSTLLAPFDATTNSILGDYSKVALNERNHDTIKSYGAAQEMNYRLSDPLQLKGLVSYRRSATKIDIDSDDTDQFVSHVHQQEAQHQTSAEVNLTGKFSRFDFVSGLYYFAETVHTDVEATAYARALKRSFLPVNTTRAYAAFGQGTYRITDRLSLTLGARYTYEKKAIDQLFGAYTVPGNALVGAATSFRLDRNFSAFTPKAQLEYRPHQNLMFYASATKGYKSGGFNFSGTSPLSTAFDPESVWSYEIGEKGDFFNHLLRFNVTGFLYHYKDLQQFIAITTGVANIENAAKARVRGIEVETILHPARAFQIGANVSFLDAVYTSYPGAPLPQPLGATPVDASGNRLNNSPKFSGNAFAQYQYPLPAGDITVRPEFSWFGRQYYEPTNVRILSQGAYALVNLTVGYHSTKGWAVDLWARNLADKQYLIATASNGATYSGQPGDPRTFGVRVSTRW